MQCKDAMCTETCNLLRHRYFNSTDYINGVAREGERGGDGFGAHQHTLFNHLKKRFEAEIKPKYV